MEIKKVLHLSEDEFNALVKAGEVIKGVKEALENKDADILSDGARDLIEAVSNITKDVLK